MQDIRLCVQPSGMRRTGSREAAHKGMWVGGVGMAEGRSGGFESVYTGTTCTHLSRVCASILMVGLCHCTLKQASESGVRWSFAVEGCTEGCLCLGCGWFVGCWGWMLGCVMCPAFVI